MSTPRFFVSPGAIHGERVTLTSDLAHQIRTVLRLRAGERVVLLDNTGWEYEAELDSVAEVVSARIVETRRAAHEPRVRLTLYQALLKADKFEWVLQKGTELGIAAFVPFVSERVVRGDVSANKMERWQRIVREAAEQSARGFIPRLAEPVPFAHAVQMAEGLALIAYEAERAVSLRAVLQQDLTGLRDPSGLSMNLFIGPEGGFAEREIELASKHCITPITLGPRILRAETAGLVAASAILYELGEME